MLIIKVWWSIFVPKNTEAFDARYLKDLSTMLCCFDEKICLVHGTGNVWHGFVHKYGVSRDTFSLWKDISRQFFEKIDDIFSLFSRVSLESLLRWNIDIKKIAHKTIIGGDIDSQTLEILASDEAIWYMMKHTLSSMAICLTDVDGVLDEKGNVIPEIQSRDIWKIHFWEKQWDASWWMEKKLQVFSDYIAEPWQCLWIINGHYLERLKELIQTGNTVGTMIYK